MYSKYHSSKREYNIIYTCKKDSYCNNNKSKDVNKLSVILKFPFLLLIFPELSPLWFQILVQPFVDSWNPTKDDFLIKLITRK